MDNSHILKPGSYIRRASEGNGNVRLIGLTPLPVGEALRIASEMIRRSNPELSIVDVEDAARLLVLIILKQPEDKPIKMGTLLPYVKIDKWVRTTVMLNALAAAGFLAVASPAHAANPGISKVTGWYASDHPVRAWKETAAWRTQPGTRQLTYDWRVKRAEMITKQGRHSVEGPVIPRATGQALLALESDVLPAPPPPDSYFHEFQPAKYEEHAHQLSENVYLVKLQGTDAQSPSVETNTAAIAAFILTRVPEVSKETASLAAQLLIALLDKKPGHEWKSAGIKDVVTNLGLQVWRFKSVEYSMVFLCHLLASTGYMWEESNGKRRFSDTPFDTWATVGASKAMSIQTWIHTLHIYRIERERKKTYDVELPPSNEAYQLIRLDRCPEIAPRSAFAKEPTTPMSNNEPETPTPPVPEPVKPTYTPDPATELPAVQFPYERTPSDPEPAQLLQTSDDRLQRHWVLPEREDETEVYEVMMEGASVGIKMGQLQLLATLDHALANHQRLFIRTNKDQPWYTPEQMHIQLKSYGPNDRLPDSVILELRRAMYHYVDTLLPEMVTMKDAQTVTQSITTLSANLRGGEASALEVTEEITEITFGELLDNPLYVEAIQATGQLLDFQQHYRKGGVFKVHVSMYQSVAPLLKRPEAGTIKVRISKMSANELTTRLADS